MKFLGKPIRFHLGERGIRTLGMGLPYDALAMRYLRPLGHLSSFCHALKVILVEKTKKINLFLIKQSGLKKKYFYFKPFVFSVERFLENPTILTVARVIQKIKI